jgi:putative ABC transport system permease protein
MKILDTLKTANSNLFRSKLRTLLTVSAVFIGALTLLLTAGVGAGLKNYVDEQLAGVGAENVLIVMAQSDENPLDDAIKEYDPEKRVSTSNSIPYLTNDDVRIVSGMEHIQKVTPNYMVSPLYITVSGEKKLVATLSQSVDGMNQPLKSGKNVNGASSGYEVTLPPGYVGALGFDSDQDAVGEVVEFVFVDASGVEFTEKATVVGVQEKSVVMANSMTANSVFVKDVYDRVMNGVPEELKARYLGIIAYFDPNISDETLTEIKDSLTKEGLIGMTVEDQLGIIKSVIDGIITFLLIFGVITLLAATFGIVNTLLMAVQERTREIGLMKALGMSRGKIFTIFSAEAVLIGFWGSVAALIVATVIAQVGSHVASTTFLKDFEGLELITLTPMNVLAVVGAVVVIAFLAATMPARRASKLDPIEALRYE